MVKAKAHPHIPAGISDTKREYYVIKARHTGIKGMAEMGRREEVGWKVDGR